MNADQLLEIMQTGAVVREMWKPRTFQQPRRICILIYADGHQEHIQHSTLNALRGQGKVDGRSLFFGGYEYKAKS